MNIQLRYFTGTGNSWKVLDTCKNVFSEEGHDVQISALDPNEKEILEADIIGFAFPVYSFGIPRIARRYLNSLKKFVSEQKVFFILTAGDAKGVGLSTKIFESILKRKNCKLIFSDVLKMPNNWIPFSHPLTMEENLQIIVKGIERSEQIAHHILNNKIEKYDYRQQSWFFKNISNVINILFRNFGTTGLKSLFKVYDSCNGCGLCAKACPTNTIVMLKGKPKWAFNTCEQCMRCVHVCPQESIFQLMGGHTKGKNRYMEPDFDPMKK